MPADIPHITDDPQRNHALWLLSLVLAEIARETAEDRGDDGDGEVTAPNPEDSQDQAERKE